MLSSAEFKEWGKSVVLFAHITTQIPGKKYDDLLGKKGGGGWPHIVALDAEGEVTAKAGGRSVEGFKSMIEAGAKFTEISKKAEKTAEDKQFLFGHELDLGRLKADEAKKRLADLGELPAEKKKGYEARILDLEIQDVLPKSRAKDKAEFEGWRIAGGKKFAEMYKAGRIPADSSRSYAPYFEWMMYYAESEQDADLFEVAMNKLKSKFGSQARLKAFFDSLQAKLDGMRKSSEDDEGDDEETDDDDGGM